MCEGYGKPFTTFGNTGPGFLEGSPAGGELRGVTAWWRREAGVTAGEEGQRAIESESSEEESAIERYSFLARTYTDGNSATAKLKLIARFHSTPVRISKHNVTKHNG